MATSRVLPLEGDYYRSQRISIASVYVLPYFYHLSLDVRGKLEIHRELVSVASQRASLMFFAGSKGAINRRVGRELGRESRVIRLQGYFQRYEYYRPYKQLIRTRWLPPLPSVAAAPDAGDLVMHVRRKDYIAYGWAASFSYYQSALDRHNFKRLVLVTDDPQGPFFLRFRSYRPIFFRGNAQESFAFMARAKRLVISQSSFSWWAAFLSEAESVVMPKPSFGIWAEPDVDLSIDDEPRFTVLETYDPYRPNRLEKLYISRRNLNRKIYDLLHTFKRS